MLPNLSDARKAVIRAVMGMYGNTTRPAVFKDRGRFGDTWKM